MVASRISDAERFVPLPQPFLDGRWRVPRFTRQDAQALMQLGIVPEDASTELLNGLIVLKDRATRGQDPSMIGRDHVKSVEKLSDLRSLINSPLRHVRSQQPLVCSETHVPEPDFMVVRGTLDDYSDLPSASDALCVVEVADASYERDTTEKLHAYALAEVAQYVVVNLRNRTAEIFINPDTIQGTYPPPSIVAADGLLTLRVGAGDDFVLQLTSVLP